MQTKENLLLCESFQPDFASTLLQPLYNFLAISVYSAEQNCAVFFKSTGEDDKLQAGKRMFRERNSTNERTNSLWANLGWKVEHS